MWICVKSWGMISVSVLIYRVKKNKSIISINNKYKILIIMIWIITKKIDWIKL